MLPAGQSTYGWFVARATSSVGGRVSADPQAGVYGSRKSPAAWLNDATASVSSSYQHSPSVAGLQLGHDVRDATHALLIRISIPLNSTTPNANKRVIRV